MGRPVLASAGTFELVLEEQPRDVTAVRRRVEKQIHLDAFPAGREREFGQQRDGLAALLKQEGGGMHPLQGSEFGGRIHYDDPPQGGWL